tara:strand:+ start:105 stop:452 length:348 start_codon:yes stop_codon:yes gene_type:complete
MSPEDRERAKEWIERIRKENEGVLNPESSMESEGLLASVWGAISGALGRVGGGTLPHAQVGQTVMQQVQAMPPENQAKVAMLLLAGGAAAGAGATGVGLPLVAPILAGGAALASQ